MSKTSVQLLKKNLIKENAKKAIGIHNNKIQNKEGFPDNFKITRTSFLFGKGIKRELNFIIHWHFHSSVCIWSTSFYWKYLMKKNDKVQDKSEWFLHCFKKFLIDEWFLHHFQMMMALWYNEEHYNLSCSLMKSLKSESSIICMKTATVWHAEGKRDCK